MKHNFQYELRKQDGTLKISVIKSTHEKFARQALKLRFPHCEIIMLKPVGHEIDFGSQNTNSCF